MNTITPVVEAIRKRFGDDVAQDMWIILEQKRRAGKLIEDPLHLQNWAFLRAKTVKFKYDSQMPMDIWKADNKEDPHELDKLILLREIMETRKGKVLHKYVTTGGAGGITRQRINQIRKELKEYVETIKGAD